MSALRFGQATTIVLLLMTAAAIAFVIQLVSPMGPSAPVRIEYYATVFGSALILALLWGATLVGLLALWNAIRGEPLRSPVAAFAIGVTAFVAVQLYAQADYDYETMQSATANPPPIPSEPVEETN